MRANSLIPILIEIFDFPIETGRRIDRVLAEAGLRAKAKGRNLPDMERREALTFLLACMVTSKTTKANEEVLRWLTARGKVNAIPSLKAEREWGLPDSDSDEYQHHIAMEALIVPYKNQDGEVSLIDYLLALCDLIQQNHSMSERVQLDIDFSDLSACVVLEDEDGDRFLTDQFLVVDPATNLPPELARRMTGIKRKCSIKGIALLEIIIRT